MPPPEKLFLGPRTGNERVYFRHAGLFIMLNLTASRRSDLDYGLFLGEKEPYTGFRFARPPKIVSESRKGRNFDIGM